MKTRLKHFLLSMPGFEALCRGLTRRHVRALMYHRFHEDGAVRGPGAGRSTLQAHMDLIISHHDVITPSQHLAAIQGHPGGHCPVVITVDDGYEDFHRVAYPVFRDAGLPAMLFVTTGFVSGHIWFWWDELAFILEQARTEDTVFHFETESFKLTLSTASGRSLAWHELADRCRFLANEKKERLIRELARFLEVEVPTAPPPKVSAVNWDQIREMAGGGVLFGAHTVSHPILTRIEPADLPEEVSASRQHLEQELGRPVSWFCYTQGGPADYDDQVKALVSKEFEGCYLSFQNLQEPPDPYALPRYGVPEDFREFRWMLCGAEFLFLKFKRILGRPTGVPSSYWKGSHEHNHAQQ